MKSKLTRKPTKFIRHSPAVMGQDTAYTLDMSPVFHRTNMHNHSDSYSHQLTQPKCLSTVGGSWSIQNIAEKHWPLNIDKVIPQIKTEKQA